MKKNKNEWNLIPHSYQIADTGDYDGHYEVTDGTISLLTKDDDDEALAGVVKALNDSGCKFYQDDAAEFELKLLKEEITKKSTLESILAELLLHKITVVMNWDSTYGIFTYEISGFYKSGTVRLIPMGGKIEAHSRYNEVDEIDSIKDLCFLNLHWWKSSRDRYDGWKSPDGAWIPLLEKYGMISTKTETVKSYYPQ